MSVTLPTTPAPADANPRLLDWGGDPESSLGGPTQRVERIGSRFALDVILPEMTAETAANWIPDLLEAKRSSGVLAFPQLGLPVGDEGAPRVNGAGQLGTSLAIDGLPASKVVRKGWAFSIITNGRRYLHMIKANVTASAGGAATLTIEPPLRRAPSDNAVVELAVPKIEGFPRGNETGWNVNTAMNVGLSFTLVERE